MLVACLVASNVLHVVTWSYSISHAMHYLEPCDWDVSLCGWNVSLDCVPRFSFEGPSFVHLSSPNTLLWCHPLPGRTKPLSCFFPFLDFILLESNLPLLGLAFPGPGSCAGITPIIWSQNFLNRAPWSGLVIKSPIMSPVGHQTTFTLPPLTRLVIKKYRMLMCFVCLLLKAFPFFSIRIVLLLSWYKTLSRTWYP